MDEYLHFLDAAIVDGFIYFASSGFNGLYRWSIAKRKTEFLHFFPEEDIYCKNLYGHIIKYGDDLFFLPIHGKSICTYNTKNGNMERINIGKSDKESTHISSYIELEDKYLLIPADLKKDFWYFYPNDRKLKKAFEVSKNLHCLIKDEDSAVCRYNGACLFKNEIMISVVNKQYMLNINVISGKTKKILINSFKANNMFVGNNYLWLISAEGQEIVKWYSEGNYERITFSENGEKAFFSVVAYKDTFLLLPWRGKEVKKYDTEKESWETFISLDNNVLDEEYSDGSEIKYCSSGSFGNLTFLYPSSTNELICINSDNDNISTFSVLQVVKNDRFQTEYLKRKLKNSKYVYETSKERDSVDAYIKLILG